MQPTRPNPAPLPANHASQPNQEAQERGEQSGAGETKRERGGKGKLLTVGPVELGDGIDEPVVEVSGPSQPRLGVGRQHHARARPAAAPVRTQPAPEGRRVGVREDAAVADQAGEHLLAESTPLVVAAAVGLLRKLGRYEVAAARRAAAGEAACGSGSACSSAGWRTSVRHFLCARVEPVVVQDKDSGR
jgi:hypothetical protein